MYTNFRVGQFVLDRKLGQGGMAEVWLGHNALLGTPVAVKFLAGSYAGHPELEQRFLREAQRQGALDHPNIVKVYGFEYVQGRSFLVMQYIDGETLDDRIQRLGRRPLPANDILRIASGALSGLDFAHSRHIVHRDIKPSNIMVDRNLYAYLGDFGLVLVKDDQRLTRTGTMMGTPLYMSPEQITRPRDVDHRTDIYSFGCVLYEMFAGRTPFEHLSGDSDFNVKLGHTSQPPPPLRSFNPSVSLDLEALVFRCLEKTPDRRFQTCGQLRDELERIIATPLPIQRTTPAPRPITVDSALQKMPWGLTIAMMLTGLFAFFDFMLMLRLAQYDSRRAFGISPHWTLAVILFVLSQFQVFAGRLVDRLGPRRMLLIGTIWCSACVAFWTLPFLRERVAGVALLFIFALGLGETVVFLAFSSFLSALPAARRGIAAGLIFAGTFAVPVLIQELRPLTSNGLLMFLAIPILGLFAGLFCYFAARKVTAPTMPDSRTMLPWSAILGKQTIALAGSYVAAGFVTYLFVCLFAFDQYYNPTSMDLPFVAMAVCSFIGGLLTDRLTLSRGKRLGRRIPVIAGMSLAAVFFVLAATRLTNPWMLTSAGAGALGLSISSFWSLTADLGGSSAGSVSGVMRTGGLMGGAVAAALSFYSPQLAALTGAIFCVFGCLISLLVNPERELA